MIEQITLMQTEDGIISLERTDGSVIHFPACNVPATYKEGDIVQAIVHSEDNIEFISLDEDAMNERRQRVRTMAARIRARALRTTNKKI